MYRHPASPLRSYHGHFTQGSRKDRDRTARPRHTILQVMGVLITVRIRPQSKRWTTTAYGHQCLPNTMLPRAALRGNAKASAPPRRPSVRVRGPRHRRDRRMAYSHTIGRIWAFGSRSSWTADALGRADNLSHNVDRLFLRLVICPSSELIEELKSYELNPTTQNRTVKYSRGLPVMSMPMKSFMTSVRNPDATPSAIAAIPSPPRICIGRFV